VLVPTLSLATLLCSGPSAPQPPHPPASARPLISVPGAGSLGRCRGVWLCAGWQALGERGFPVPQAIDSNRHCVLMSLVDASPM